MYEITVKGEFRASHALLGADGTREPLHEHDWQVQVTVSGRELDAQGLLVDFGQLRESLRGVLLTMQAQELNRLPAFASVNPSAEVVARWVAERLSGHLPGGVWLDRVSVEEEPGCVACYRPPAGDVVR